MRKRYFGIVRRVGLLVVMLSAGCASIRPEGNGQDIHALSLTLVQAGNISGFLPAAIFVERPWCYNLLSKCEECGPARGDYTLGVAVLIVENRGVAPLKIPWWTYANWRVVLEPEGGEVRTCPLASNRRVESPAPVNGSVYTMELGPGNKAAYVVGVDGCGPDTARYGTCPWPPCKMHVEYGVGETIIRSNDLPVRWRDDPKFMRVRAAPFPKGEVEEDELIPAEDIEIEIL